MFSGGDPEVLLAQAPTIRQSAQGVGAVASDLSGASHDGAGAVGDPVLAAAVDRFGAAISGEMLALEGATSALGVFAGTVGEQLLAVTGGE